MFMPVLNLKQNKTTATEEGERESDKKSTVSE